jgi:hypothetical protein
MSMVASRLQARGVRAECQSQLCPFPPVTLTRPHGKKNAAVVLVAGGASLLSAGMTIVAGIVWLLRMWMSRAKMDTYWGCVR